MKFLTTKDWLDKTRDSQLQSEADYRIALANLRLRAKNLTVGVFFQGIRDFSKANNGRRPQNLESIIQYLPQDFVSSILERYTSNPSGEAYGDSSQNWIIKEAELVDDLWDSTIFVSDRSRAMLRPPDQLNTIVTRDAIAQYENEHGAIPTTFHQITKYIYEHPITKAFLKDTLDETKVEKIYKSMMTPIQ
jgi:hypothetical protein